MSLSNTLYTAQAGQVKQESMEDRLAGLEKEKQLKYLLWKIGNLTEREGLGLEEYWPHMKAWEDLEEPERDRVLKALGEETRALELLEEAQSGHARWALTMRDKLLYSGLVQRQAGPEPPGKLRPGRGGKYPGRAGAGSEPGGPGSGPGGGISGSDNPGGPGSSRDRESAGLGSGREGRGEGCRR